MSKKSPPSAKPAFTKAAAPRPQKVMSPKPSGTEGPKPPKDAKLAMDRQQFARQSNALKSPGPAPGGSTGRGINTGIAKNAPKVDAAVTKINQDAKARLTSKSPQSAKPAFGRAASKGATSTAFNSSGRGKGAAKSAFNSASRGGGKGGKRA